jgi:hypothetical protein
MALFTKRVKGLSDVDAEKALAEDIAALHEWLASHEIDPLQFALGFTLMVTPADLVNLIKEEAEKANGPKLCLQMELPPGARLRRVEGSQEHGKLVTLKGLWLAIDALTKEAVDNLFDANLGPGCGWLAPSVSEVRFGPVAGRKRVTKGESPQGPLKQIAYALTVPGGHVFGAICLIDKKVDQLNWDETPFEACFHTLRVETQPQPP